MGDLNILLDCESCSHLHQHDIAMRTKNLDHLCQCDFAMFSRKPLSRKGRNVNQDRRSAFASGPPAKLVSYLLESIVYSPGQTAQ